MNVLKVAPSAVVVAMILVSFTCRAYAAAPGPKVSVSGNKHNLSALNTDPGVKYKAFDDPVGNPRGRQICIFCHTPHNANVAEQAPLWSRAFSGVSNFQRYTSLTLHIRGIAAAQYGAGAQPNGSSKLCLSCHDGVSRLGVVSGGSEITMAGGGLNDVISGIASFNPSTNKMLTGHHPVSFVYLTGFSNSSQTGAILSGLPASYRFMPQSSAGKVRLSDTKRNGNGWMQCTTCHDPHQNQADDSSCFAKSNGALVTCDTSTNPTNTRRVAPFWAYHGTSTTATQDTTSVCKVCHATSTGLSAPGLTPPWATTFY